MAGPRNSRTGAPLYPGYFTSAVAETGPWPTWITGLLQGFFGNGFFGRFFVKIPAPGVRDFETRNFDSDIAGADPKTAPILSALATDFSPFRRSHPKGKITMWHGWEDPAIAAAGAVAHVDRVRQANDDANEAIASPPIVVRCRECDHCACGDNPPQRGDLWQRPASNLDMQLPLMVGCVLRSTRPQGLWLQNAPSSKCGAS